MHTQELKLEARRLRRLGYSLKDISKTFSIAKSTASKWVMDIKLGPAAEAQLSAKLEQGRHKGLSSMQVRRQKTYNAIFNIVKSEVDSIILDKSTKRLLCSFLYWGEGAKTSSTLNFTNSDPALIQTFLYLLRSGFNIEESKLSAFLHLHDYHDRSKQLQFWSKTTKIPEHRIGIYNKPHTGVVKREGYPGCISIRYSNVRLFKALTNYYTILARKMGA
jgi:hypothetical protein